MRVMRHRLFVQVTYFIVCPYGGVACDTKLHQSVMYLNVVGTLIFLSDLPVSRGFVLRLMLCVFSVPQVRSRVKVGARKCSGPQPCHVAEPGYLR